ncbi:SLATT domain-containing protein [Fusibacter sp. 3D3]|uniref:SLATT domain-containing protein n=1 Tax=Fusibacter sp. 3D3 TaxID=1048380 RepID=UPI0008531D24|nr:SLATT domain-containing protein [Fusibacter sp. 3D3]GAU76042.1 hypothetical protein F3D3_0638 [Fusibacter sp. 3D3]
MDNKKYVNEYSSLEKWKDICEVTLSNYANMKKRLTRRETTSNFVLIYYSIALIIFTLTNKYYPEIFNGRLSEYFSLILSVILLVYSLINKNARYSERIGKVEESMNAIKTIKRHLKSENLEEQIEIYNNIVDKTEMRSDVDFFNTIKSHCKRNDIKWYSFIEKISVEENDKEKKKIKGYLSEIDRFHEQTGIIFQEFCDFSLIIIPALVFVLCVIESFVKVQA